MLAPLENLSEGIDFSQIPEHLQVTFRRHAGMVREGARTVHVETGYGPPSPAEGVMDLTEQPPDVPIPGLNQEIDKQEWIEWVAAGMPGRDQHGNEVFPRYPPILAALGMDESSDYLGVASLNLVGEEYSFSSYLTEKVPAFVMYMDKERIFPSNPAEMQAAYGDFLELEDTIQMFGSLMSELSGISELDTWDRAQEVYESAIQSQGYAREALAAGYDRRAQIKRERVETLKSKEIPRPKYTLVDIGTAWAKDFQTQSRAQFRGVLKGDTEWPARYADTRSGAIWDFSEAQSPSEVEDQIVKDIEYLNEKITMELGRAPTIMRTASGQASATERSKLVERMQQSVEVLRVMQSRLGLVKRRWQGAMTTASLRWDAYYNDYLHIYPTPTPVRED
jgi:hypothetical protein